MQYKLIAALLALSLGAGFGTATLAADEPKQRAPQKRLTVRANDEDLVARAVFQTLLGEVALQRGDIRLSSDAWMDLAQRTRDPKAIARATEIAGFARQYDRAIELTQLWLEVEPNSEAARQAQTSLLALANRPEELSRQIAAQLESDVANRPANLMHLHRLLGRLPDKAAVLRMVERLVAPYAKMPEAHMALAQAAANAGDNTRALNETDAALKLRPNWEIAAIARAQLQAAKSPAAARQSLSDFVAHHPKADDARLALARLLIAEKRYDEARQHFDLLLRAHPDNLDVIYPVAMLALQQGDTKTGRTQLEHLLATDFPNKSSIHFFLGQLDQEQNQNDAAMAQYRQVGPGPQYLPARARLAQLLAQQGRIDEAREVLRDTQGGTPAQRAQLSLAEAQLLRDEGRPQDAYIVLTTALSIQPDNTDLLYEAALTAERIGKPEQLEAHLKHLLSLNPDHPQALNALGYSWADRNIRLDEAQVLIARALSLAPDDPYIMDSLGWVKYRRGEAAEAAKILERAYRLKADPEIAAHLGEVLWQLDRKDEARQLIADALKVTPDSDILRNAAKKILP